MRWAILCVGLVGCAHVAPPPKLPPRDELHSAILMAAAGVKAMRVECQNQAAALAENDRGDEAEALIHRCVMDLRPAYADLGDAFDVLRDWTPEEAVRLACDAKSAVSAYESLLPVLERGGFVSHEAEDGAMRARWLVGMCR